ncbi:uncharacterized protein LOC143569617 [Bidens hawaiensis]|uniref:uncharacterized protein LOC143569617 n=1 Tax=Bidens hawaiensis TaxID=980011 RepID=UPI0040493B53
MVALEAMVMVVVMRNGDVVACGVEKKEGGLLCWLSGGVLVDARGSCGLLNAVVTSLVWFVYSPNCCLSISYQISEYDVIEISENVCNLKKQEADWILKIGIVEQSDRLELVEQDSAGQCGSECKTIERACQEVIGYYDTDVAEYIYQKKPTLSSLVKILCKDLTKACNTKPPPVPKDREPGEIFVPKSAKEAEMEKMLKSMEGIPGAPSMKMYSREELMSGKGFNDEDDEEEEQSIPSNLGKILREKESDNKKVDWKQKITEGIKSAGEATKKHATKTAFKLQKWWNAKKATFTQHKSKSAKVEL